VPQGRLVEVPDGLAGRVTCGTRPNSSMIISCTVMRRGQLSIWRATAVLGALSSCGRIGYSPDLAPSPDASPNSAIDAQQGRADANLSIPVVASCSELHMRFPSEPSGVYRLDPDGSGPVMEFLAYCEQFEDGGGWTLVLKIDGTARTFLGGSELWTNDVILNGMAPDLDQQEAKLLGYATVAFSEIRVGMLEAGQQRWIIIPLTGNSTRDLFASGQVSTAVGRDAWLSLMASPSLQANCNDEGVNVANTAGEFTTRLGIQANDEINCSTNDSTIGFGFADQAPLTAGNLNDKDGTVIPVFGSLMVR
jgi:hypothetical protein